ncbi:MAG: hypothetical protein R6U30_15945 [Halomonas sp.]|uniref:hypothetical protein n=1 Tax=Halomonas sp. TaxID=1486246 RepID=UPI00397070A8
MQSTTEMPRRIGRVGVGPMGPGIARSLPKAGHSRVFRDPPGHQSVDDLLEVRS